MMHTGEHFLDPHGYVALLNTLTPQQRDSLNGEYEKPSHWGEGWRQRLFNRKRKPGSGRKPLGTKPEYLTALNKVVALQSSDSLLAYSTQSARSLARAMKKQGAPCSSASIPRLAYSYGLRVHPRIKPSPRIKPIKPTEQFEFIGRRLEHILSGNTGAALHIVADPQHKTPVNCPADRLATWQGKALTTHVQKFLTAQQEYFATKKIDELMLIVEGGGLLGLRNKHLPRVLLTFACLTGITVFLSYLPSGLSRIATDLLAEEVLLLTKEQWALGSVHLKISRVNTSYPPSNPKDGNFRPDSWNRIIRPLTSFDFQ